MRRKQEEIELETKSLENWNTKYLNRIESEMTRMVLSRKENG
jgi:hypothetical protein